MAGSQANDSMIRRLEKELEERNAAAQGIVSTAQDSERDLNDAERETMASAGTAQRQGPAHRAGVDREAAEISRLDEQLDQALVTARRSGDVEINYRSAGHCRSDQGIAR